MAIVPTEFRCPACLGDVDSDIDSLACSSCGASFNVRDEIVDFRGRNKDYYFNPVPSDKMGEIIEKLSPESWTECIRDFIAGMGRPNNAWLDNLVVDGRYSWKLFLDLKPDTVLLDLGCGLGNLTKNLAPHVAKAYALDLTYRRLEFSRGRFRIFNEDDDIVLVAGGDGRHLPFPDDALDCVVLSGVLEWVGSGDSDWFIEGPKWRRLWNMLSYQFGERSPRNIQLAFLREIRRVMKPDGQLFVAIENRLNHEYFTGRPDHHSRLKYGALLPRVLANIYSIYKNRRPYRTYTYGIEGYKRLFRAAGFTTQEFLGLTRGYTNLREILPAEVDAPEWKPISKPARVRDRLERSKYFAPAFGIIASNRARPWARLQDGLLDAVADITQCAGGRRNIEIEDYRITTKDKVVLSATATDRKVIIKIPMNDTARCDEETNAKLLRDIGSEEGCSWVSRHLGNGADRELRFFVETRMPGVALGELQGPNRRAEALRHAEKVREQMDNSGPSSNVALEGEIYERLVENRLRDLEGILAGTGLKQNFRAFFRDSLYGASIRLGLSHGDLNVDTIFVADDVSTGVIDWKHGEPQGIELLDVVNVLMSVHAHHGGQHDLESSFDAMATSKWPVAAEFRFLESCYERYGMDIDKHFAFTHLWWLQTVSRGARYSLPYDAEEIEKHVVRRARRIP